MFYSNVLNFFNNNQQQQNKNSSIEIPPSINIITDDDIKSLQNRNIKINDKNMLLNSVANDMKQHERKWIIKNSNFNMINEFYFNSKLDACNYIQQILYDDMKDDLLDYIYDIEIVCIDNTSNIIKFENMELIPEYISFDEKENNNIDIVIYKIVKHRKNLFSFFTKNKVSECYFIMPIDSY